MISNIGRWAVQHEPDTTRQCYSARPEGTDCKCADCQEFITIIGKVFPKDFLSITDLLGVNIRKPAELCHYGEEAGLRIIGGWFYAVGQILSGHDAMRQVSNNGGVYELEKLSETFEFGITNNLALVPIPFTGKHLVQIEFLSRVPPGLTDSPSP